MPSVLVPLAQGCEEVEAVTIIDLLRRAGIKVISAGLDDKPVVASRGVRLVPDITLDTALQSDFDMVVLPGGGAGADNLGKDSRIADLLKKMANSGKFTGAICAAPKVLAAAGLLNDRQATAFPGTLDGLNIPGMKLKTDAVVIDGRIITSRGPGTAMDFALAIIEQLSGKPVRDKVEAGLARN